MKSPYGMRQGWSKTLMVLAGCIGCLLSAAAAGAPDRFDFKLLATNRTSTMQKEMNQAASLGFRFAAVMGGETSFGGSEAVVIMQKERSGDPGS